MNKSGQFSFTFHKETVPTQPEYTIQNKRKLSSKHIKSSNFLAINRSSQQTHKSSSNIHIDRFNMKPLITLPPAILGCL